MKLRLPFTSYRTIGVSEVLAALRVLFSGKLSGFLGSAGDSFLGGKEVLKFESTAAEYFGSSYCVSFNSWSSGLFCAVGALGLEPGDEVLVPSWTMSASATAITHWGGVPVFIDVDPKTYTMNPDEVEKAISSKTRGIVIVDIFGNPSQYDALIDIAKKFNLWTLGDCAQAPGAKYGGKHVSSYSDIGGYSLNRHKHIQTGEGGFALTDDLELATKMRLMRNHSEQVTAHSDFRQFETIAGHNFRLGEIEAAMATTQLTKLANRVKTRRRAAQTLTRQLSKIKGFVIPESDAFGTSAFYLYPILLSGMTTEKRQILATRLRGIGVPGLIVGYQNIHKLPFFAKNSKVLGSRLSLSEELYSSTFLGIQLCSAKFGLIQTTLLAHKISREVKNLV